jgi:hypothetical protein
MMLRRVDRTDATCFSARLRAKRIAPLVAIIKRVHAERGRVSIIDIGGTADYWRIVPRAILDRCNVTITVVNLPGMLAEDHGDPRFRHVEGDGCDLAEWEDQSFDIAHSNSVIEHVGDWSRVCAFASEVRRVARFYFVQTPHFWFPVEPHCMTPVFHWLPRSWRIAMVMRWNLGNWTRQPSVHHAVRTVESARLLDGPMFGELFGADATIRTERFFGLPKSMVAVREHSAA